MAIDVKTTEYDGKDEIFFSNSFNIYEDELIISNVLGFKFKFIFEKQEPQKDQNDVVITLGDKKEIVVTFSKKFRNSLGSSTSEKLSILKAGDNRQVLLSVFGQQIGDGKCLHITINFYLR